MSFEDATIMNNILPGPGDRTWDDGAAEEQEADDGAVLGQGE